MELRNASRNSAHHFIFTDVSDVPGLDTVWLDITNKDAVSLVVDSERVDVIVNCAGYTAVDRAEDDEAMARLLNADAPGYLAEVAASYGASLIHISTDYVFSGKDNVPVPETAEPCPQSVYGRTKLAGEKAVRNSSCNYVIIRTAWLYSPYGKNFVKTMKRLTRDNDSIKVVVDQVGSPTCAADLAAAILTIIDSGKISCKGVYHFTDEGAISWYDFARHICSLSGNKCRVEPCLSQEFPSKVDRPHYSVLDKTLIKNTFGVDVPYWLDSLEKYISKC